MSESLVTPTTIGTIGIGQRQVRLFEAAEDQTAITLYRDRADSLENIFNDAKEQITATRWWTWEYWEEKGLPKEQIEFSDGEHDVTIFNYRNEPLAVTQVDQIREVLKIFSRINSGQAFKGVRYILIDDEQPMNSKTGQMARGKGLPAAKAVVLYPRALAPVPYQVTDKATNLEGTLAHEMTHPLVHDVLNEWEKIGKWQYLEERRPLPGGFTTSTITTEPERCVSDYATSDSDEDMCESMVAALFEQEKLDPEKLTFLQRKFPLVPAVESAGKIDKIDAVDIALPITPSEFGITFKNLDWEIIDSSDN